MTPKKIYYVNGQVFNEDNARKSLAFAKHYAKENKIDESEIYGLNSDTEIAYLKKIIDSGATNIFVHKKVPVLAGFVNHNNDVIEETNFDVTFIYEIEGKKHYVVIVENVYGLSKSLILYKTMFDYQFQENYYIEVYCQKDNEWVEWKIGDLSLSIQEKKERHKKYLAQKKVIRDRQKYDRLIQLRSKGMITDNQSKELYRLEKVFGGKE